MSSSKLPHTDGNILALTPRWQGLKYSSRQWMDSAAGACHFTAPITRNRKRVQAYAHTQEPKMPPTTTQPQESCLSENNGFSYCNVNEEV